MMKLKFEKEIPEDAALAITHITYYARILDGLIDNFDKEIGIWCGNNGVDVKAVPMLLKRAKEELVGTDFHDLTEYK